MDVYEADARKERQKYLNITLQDGPIGEVGVNGCQIDDVIAYAVSKIREFNAAFPCRENSLAITHLEDAENWLMRRRLNRMQQGVEGLNKAHTS